MNYLKNIDWSLRGAIKAILAFLAVLSVITIFIVIFSFLNSFVAKVIPNFNYPNSLYSNQVKKYKNDFISYNENSYGSDLMEAMPVGEPLSQDLFEVRRYSSLIKSNDIISDCKLFDELKTKEFVVFENSNFYEKRCNFRFKALKDNELDIVAFIEDFSPDYINLNISNIVKEINNYDSRLDSLNSRLEAVEDTLLKSRKAYDDIALLATKEKDVETLAKVIDNKLNLIDKMNNKKLNLLDEISRYNKYKNDSLEKVDYVHFDVSITKDVLLDTKELKEGWRESFSQWLGDLNSIVKSLTLYLLFYIVKFIQYSIYFLLLVGGVKFVYRFAKCLWKRV
jgi:hypothetical protein